MSVNVGRTLTPCGRPSCCHLLVTFHEIAGLESGTGAYQGDQVGRVDCPPPVVRGLDELERHGQACGAAAGSNAA